MYLDSKNMYISYKSKLVSRGLLSNYGMIIAITLYYKRVYAYQQLVVDWRQWVSEFVYQRNFSYVKKLTSEYYYYTYY